ncbi:MAG: phosphate/sulfate permease [Candidatus Nanohaloarchaea archaeon]|jgi:phosphate/sulfate permease
MDLILAIALLASGFMGVSIGASSVAPAFGPVNSSGTASVLRSALLAGVFAFIGSVVQGANVSSTVGSGILGAELAVLEGAVVLLIGSALVIASVLTDYPMPTAFTLVGAVIGVGLGSGYAVSNPVMTKIVLYWLLIPIPAALLGYGIARVLRRVVPEEGSENYIKALLLISGSYMAYTAGAGSVGLAVGPLQSTGYSMNLLLILGGMTILLGSWLYSPRIIRAVSVDYTNMGPRRSIAALLSASFLAQIGIFLGVPISFNEAIIASVIGSGLVESRSNFDAKKISRTAGAWVSAFLLAIAIGFSVSKVLLVSGIV